MVCGEIFPTGVDPEIRNGMNLLACLGVSLTSMHGWPSCVNEAQAADLIILRTFSHAVLGPIRLRHCYTCSYRLVGVVRKCLRNTGDIRGHYLISQVDISTYKGCIHSVG
jgi:hypothetical protein